MSKNVCISTIIYQDEKRGLKESKCNNENLRMLQFNRNIVQNLSNYKLMNNNSIYFLRNRNEIYVGQTNNLIRRIEQHLKEKKFSNTIAFVMDNNDLSKTFIDYLEYYYINAFKKSNFKLVNSTLRNFEPKISEFEKASIHSLIKTINFFLFSINIILDNKTEESNLDNKTEESNLDSDERSKFVKTFQLKNNDNFYIYSGIIINKNERSLDSGFVRGHLSKIKHLISYDNIKQFIYERAFVPITQNDLEKKIFGVDSHGNIAKGLRELIGIDFRKLKNNIQTKQEFDNLINQIDKDIISAIEIIKKI